MKFTVVSPGQRVARLLMFVALLPVAPAFAGTNAWTFTGPEGGPATSVAFHPTEDATAVVGSARGVHLTLNDGNFWARMFQGDINDIGALIPDPTNHGRLFALGNGIFRSTDDARTFGTSIAPAPNMCSLTIARDGVLYAANLDGRLFRSQDSGTQWVEILTRPWSGIVYVPRIFVDPSQSSTLYAMVGGTGTYKSTNAGETWTGPLAGSPGSRGPGDGGLRIVVDPGDSSHLLAATTDGIMRSVDGGATWFTQLAGRQIVWVGFDPLDVDSVWAVTRTGEFLRSDDRAVTWPVNLRPPRLAVHEVHDVALSPVTAGKILVATSEGPMLSTDAGATFTKRLTGFVTGSAASISASNDGTIFAALRYPAGLFLRSGASWWPVGASSVVDFSANASTLRKVAVAPSDSRTIFVIDMGRRLMWSTDNGVNWQGPHAQFINSPSVLTGLAIDPENPARVYLADSHNGVWLSIDHGATWQPHGVGLPVDAGPSELTISPADPTHLYAIALTSPSTSGVYRSTDAGLTWTEAASLPGNEIRSLTAHPVNADEVFAVLPTAIARSTNRGTTWTIIDNFDFTGGGFLVGAQLLIDPVYPDTWVLSSSQFDRGFLRTVDGGTTWQITPLSLSGAVTWLGPVTLNPQRPGQIVGGLDLGGMVEYEVSPDLTLSATGFDTSHPVGATVPASISVRNLGPHAASAAHLVISLPDALTISVPVGCHLMGLRMECDLPALQVGQTRSLDFILTMPSTASQGFVRVDLSGHEPDASPGNNVLSAGVISEAQSDLRVTMDAVPRVNAGASANFSAQVTNLGPSDATLVHLQVALPGGVFAQTITPTHGTCIANGSGPTLWQCDVGTLPAGVTASFAMQVRGDLGGTYDIQATVSGLNNDVVTANDQATSSFKVDPPPPINTGGGPQDGPPDDKKGGGGRFDWLAACLLAALAVLRRRPARVNVVR